MGQSAFYLLNSGEVLKRAQQYREIFIRLRTELFGFVHSMGCERACVDETMMLLRGIVFEGSPPKGWKKPCKKHGLSRPNPTKANAAALRWFTPAAPHAIKPHPELQGFLQWLDCPSSYAYKTDGGGWGSKSIGDFFNHTVLAWYSPDGPILLKTPDHHAAVLEAKAMGITPTDAALDWKPPVGCEQILIERWRLMEAEHDAVLHTANSK